jgi:hypothetical protein
MKSHTLQECKRADEHNNDLYDVRVQTAKEATLGITCARIEEPPSPDNCTRHIQWQQQNMPVSADQQARSVEALMGHDPPYRLITDYQPQHAMQFQKEKNVPFISCDSPAMAASMASGGPTYTIFTDDQLRTMTKKQCLAADKSNNQLFSQASRRCRKARIRLGPIAVVHMDDMVQSKQSNYQRRVTLKSRDVFVSALEQSKAIEFLFQKDLRLYADYEPQNAIALCITLREQESSTDDEGCPVGPPPVPPPDLVNEEANFISLVHIPVHNQARHKPASHFFGSF